MKRALLAVLTATMLATAACSGSDTPAPTETVSSAPPAPPASTAPSAEASPAFDCLTGTYRLTRFVGVGDKATYGTGEGGDVAVRFTGDTYELTSDGREPIVLTLAGQSGKLRVDGSINGTVTGDGPQLQFTLGKTKGTATLSAGSQKRTLTMAEVANVLAPTGTGTLACADDKAIVLLSDIRLELER